MKAVRYEIYIEGGLHSVEVSRFKVERMRSKFEQEGWNVTVIKIVKTVIGHAGVKI